MTESLFPAFTLEPVPQPVVLSKAQKQFNTLVKKIEALKAELAEWSDTVPRRAQLLRQDYDPLRNIYNALRVELIQLLDRACNEKYLSKNEKKKLRHLIPTITAELMHEQPDDVVKSIHDKYSDLGIDEEKEMLNEAMRSMVGEMFGVEIGDDVDLDDPEQLREVAEKVARRESEKFQEQQQKKEARRAKRGKTAKQIEKEQKAQTEAAQVRKSLQEVYRKLAAALHPDRAPDDAERERRTGLMQRVNVAYEKKDLLQLLELQLETEQIDRSHIAALPDERVQHFIKVLKEQCDELREAIDEAQMPFRFQLDLSPFERLSAKLVIARMEQDIPNMRSSIEALRHDLALFADVAHLKRWLRTYEIRREPDFDEFHDFPFEPPFGRR